jgi:hypothetical protein
VLDEAHSLEGQLTYRDKQKLDEYLVSVREIEQRIQKAERFGKPIDPSLPTPDGIPAGFDDYVQVMFDMMALAFQTDSTRIATFLLANEGSNRPFPEIGIAEGHHSLTHHMNKQDMIEKVAQIDLWYMTQFAKFLDKLEQTKDVDGNSLLHNSMIIYGSGNADGNRHTHTESSSNSWQAPGAARFPREGLPSSGQVPMTNMLLGLGSRMGARDLDRIGDSTGRPGLNLTWERRRPAGEFQVHFRSAKTL